MNIYLIRHGRQNSRLCNVDVELAKEGREQADLLGKSCHFRIGGWQNYDDMHERKHDG